MKIPVPSLRRLAAVGSLAAVTLGFGASPAFAAGGAFTAEASAQALNIQLLNSATIALSNPPTTAKYDGSQSTNQTAANHFAVSALSGVPWLTVGSLGEYAEADTTGSSYACAGTVEPGGTIQVGTQKTDCTRTGNGAGGVTVDISQIPGLGTALSSLADLKVTLDGVTSFASAGPGGASPVASSSIAGGSATITIASTLPITVPVSIPSAPNSNLLTTVINALSGANNPLLSGVVDALSNSIKPLLTLESNYQTTTNGVITVSAIHLQVGDPVAAADISTVTAGPNAQAAQTPVFPVRGLPFAFGGAGIAAALIAPWYVRRRRALQHSES
jgi:hypothetical protein